MDTQEDLNKRKIGAEKEELAATYLESRGALILERNFRCRQGEIDLIARQDGYLTFVEVKYRTTAKQGLPEEAVGIPKQKKICRVADYYRCIHGYGDKTPVRYDVVAIEGDKITWIKNAFPHHYR